MEELLLMAKINIFEPEKKYDILYTVTHRGNRAGEAGKRQDQTPQG
jgi:hypothetical protein